MCIQSVVISKFVIRQFSNTVSKTTECTLIKSKFQSLFLLSGLSNFKSKTLEKEHFRKTQEKDISFS